MKRIKPKTTGKTIRLAEATLPILRHLREAMQSTALVSSHDGPLELNPNVSLRDGDVVTFALSMARLMMAPRSALVDRDKFAQLVDRELLQGMANFAGRPERERLAMLDLILARCATFSAFHSTSPLMAATPEGRVS